MGIPPILYIPYSVCRWVGSQVILVTSRLCPRSCFYNDRSVCERHSYTTLARLRKARGLSQKELAEASGVALRMIQLYEQRQNDINKAQASSLQSLAHALGCRIEDLFE